MGKKSKKDKGDQPAVEAKQAIEAIKSYKQPVFAKTVDFGDDPDFTLITKCLDLIKEVTEDSCSVLLISAGSTDVVTAAFSVNENLVVKEWIRSALNMLSKEGDIVLSENCGRVKVSNDAFPIKEKETALANSFQYLYKIGVMLKDDESSEEMLNLNDF